MSKYFDGDKLSGYEDYDVNNRYILEGKSFVDTKTNTCLNFGLKDLNRVVIQLNCLERYLNNADQQIAELQKQLEEKEKKLKEIRVENYTIKSYRDFLNNQCKNLIKENKKLNQQLKTQLAEIVEKIKAFYKTSIYDRPNAHTEVSVLLHRLDTILQEYQK